MIFSKDAYGSLENRLLTALPCDEYERLLPNLEQVRLPRNRILYESGDEMRYAYFLNCGVASLLDIIEGGQTLDVRHGWQRGLHRSADHSSQPGHVCRIMVQMPQ